MSFEFGGSLVTSALKSPLNQNLTISGSGTGGTVISGPLNLAGAILTGGGFINNNATLPNITINSTTGLLTLTGANVTISTAGTLSVTANVTDMTGTSVSNFKASNKLTLLDGTNGGSVQFNSTGIFYNMGVAKTGNTANLLVISPNSTDVGGAGYSFNTTGVMRNPGVYIGNTSSSAPYLPFSMMGFPPVSDADPTATNQRVFMQGMRVLIAGLITAVAGGTGNCARVATGSFTITFTGGKYAATPRPIVTATATGTGTPGQVGFVGLGVTFDTFTFTNPGGVPTLTFNIYIFNTLNFTLTDPTELDIVLMGFY